MKILILALLMLPMWGMGQDIKEGRWISNGIVIERTGDLQTEDSAGVVISYRVAWHGERHYSLIAENGDVFNVTVYRVTKDGYTARVVHKGRSFWVKFRG